MACRISTCTSASIMRGALARVRFCGVPKDREARNWKIPDVQLACGREPLQVRRTRAVASGASVFHFGWACEADRVERAQRYFEHDGGKFHNEPTCSRSSGRTSSFA